VKSFRATLATVGAILLVIAGCRFRSRPTAAGGPRFDRMSGHRFYRFVSVERNPAGAKSLEVRFRLDTHADGHEDATLLRAIAWTDGGVPQTIAIPAACGEILRGGDSIVAKIPITPAPALAALIAPCVPEEIFGAATDIFSILAIPAQPQFRARELTHVGDHRTFHGFTAQWSQPPIVRAARVVADSGTIRLEALAADTARLVWDPSPMRVAILRQLAPAMAALLEGFEWFVVEVTVDPRDGVVLSARTRVDSLALTMVAPYAQPSLPLDGPASGRGAPVRIQRELRLERVP
jgi:hypothetical protein